MCENGFKNIENESDVGMDDFVDCFDAVVSTNLKSYAC